MTGEFPPSGTGGPTDLEVAETRDYLKRHNRGDSYKDVCNELKANGFTVSKATVGRAFIRLNGGKPRVNKPPPGPSTAKAQKRNDARRTRRKKDAEGQAENVAENVAKMLEIDEAKRGEIATLAQRIAEENSSTHLAILENRTRMALNTLLMEEMAARPALLLLDMRGTAALIDALTVSTKLSGGASIDITVPNPGREEPHGAVNGVSANGKALDISPNGHAMKDITPVRGPLSDELEAFRRKRAMDNGQRA